MKVITKDQFYLDQIEALKKRITQEREGVEEFKQMMNDAFKDLEAERDALAAQVEVLQQHRRELLDLIYNNAIGQVAMSYAIDGEAMANHAFSITGIDTASTAKESTPAACLAQVRAEAVLAATAYGRAQTKYFLRSSEDILSEIDQYAERIRQGGAE